MFVISCDALKETILWLVCGDEFRFAECILSSLLCRRHGQLLALSTGRWTCLYFKKENLCVKRNNFLCSRLLLRLLCRNSHKCCDACISLKFAKGLVLLCPVCKAKLRRANFHDEKNVNEVLDRELAVRRKIEREWNKRQEDFDSLDAFNDYLEEREDIIYNLVNGIDLEATQERVAQNRAANSELIARNAAKREAEEKLEQEQIRIEQERWLLRRSQFLRQDQRERLVKLRAEAEFLEVSSRVCMVSRLCCFAFVWVRVCVVSLCIVSRLRVLFRVCVVSRLCCFAFVWFRVCVVFAFVWFSRRRFVVVSLISNKRGTLFLTGVVSRRRRCRARTTPARATRKRARRSGGIDCGRGARRAAAAAGGGRRRARA